MKKLSSVVLAVIITSLWMEYSNAYIGEEHVLERIIDVVKAPDDKRLYRGLKLKNDLRILLISDKSANKSAACLTVGVGALNELTNKVQGLANIVGYMLLRGSQTYADPYNLREFVSSHGGNFHTPRTSANIQRLAFDIKSVYLEEALDRLARLFYEPVFLLDEYDETILDGPMALLEAEYVTRSLSDIPRIEQVEKTLCNNNHPYCNLFNGSSGTLFQHMEDPANMLEWKDHPRPNLASLYKKARQFFKNWYTSNNMVLVVIGKETLYELEEMVVPQFKNIQNGKPRKFFFGPTRQPWGETQLGHMIYIFPRENINLLRLIFPVPDTHEHYKTNVETFIPNLLVYDGPNSLISLLQGMRLVSDLDFSYSFFAGIAFFNITCELHESTASNVEQIVNIIFQYLHLIKICDHDALKEKFKDVGNMVQTAFLEHDYVVQDTLSYAEELSPRLLHYPAKDVLKINYTVEQWDELYIREFLDCLNPKNMNISIASQSVLDKTNQKEVHYGTFYGVEKIPVHLVEEWSSVRLIPHAELRPCNEFIAENFNLYPLNVKEMDEGPSLLHVSSKTEVWFKQDDKFRIPKLTVIFEIHSWTSKFRPYSEIFSYIFDEGLMYAMEEYLPDARRAGFKFELKFGTSQIPIAVYGYDDKILLVLQLLLQKIKDFGHQMSERLFKDLLKRYSRDFRNNIVPGRINQMDWYLDSLLMGDWTPENLYNGAKRLRYDDFKKFLSRKFQRIFVRAFIHGNCNRERAMLIADVFEKSFSTSSGLLLQEILRPRVADMTDGSLYVYQSFNKSLDLYAYFSILRINTDLTDLKMKTASMLIFKTIRDICHQSRIFGDMKLTKVPIVQCSVKSFYNIQALSIAVVSEVDPLSVDEKVKEFVHDALHLLNLMSDSHFEQIKNSVANELKTLNSSSLSNLSDDYWADIHNRVYNFRRTEILLEFLYFTKKSDLSDIFQKLLIASSHQSKLAIHVFPKDTEKIQPLLMEVPRKATKLEDINDLLTRSSLLPITVGASTPRKHEGSNSRKQDTKQKKGKPKGLRIKS